VVLLRLSNNSNSRHHKIQKFANLDEALLEENLNNFLQDGQQTRMMHANATFQQGEHI
jgi:hypothetical protein